MARHGPAVPFLSRLALNRSAYCRADVLRLLGLLARDDLDDVVTEHAGPLLALLNDDDEAVRESAAYVLGATGPDTAVLPLLAERWQVETGIHARASVLAAIGELNNPEGKKVAKQALNDPEPAIRAAAGLTLAWMGARLPKKAGDALTSAFHDGDPLEGWVWCPNDALNEMLRQFEDAARVPVSMLELLARSPSAKTRALLALVGWWGESASAAAAELLWLLDEGDDGGARRAAGLALARLGPVGERGMVVFREVAQSEYHYASLIDPLLELTDRVTPLLPALRGHLTGEASPHIEVRRLQGAVARLVWRLTSDPDEVLPTLRAVLAVTDRIATQAVDAAGELGAYGAPLIGLLRDALASQGTFASEHRIHAARALWRLGDRDSDLATPLLPRWEHWDRAEPALDLFVEMRATHVVPRLRKLLEGDQRIHFGAADQYVPNDEQLQDRLRWAIAELDTNRQGQQYR
jgi:hypothetical protein